MRGIKEVSLAGVVAHLPSETAALFKNESKAVKVTRLSGVLIQKAIDDKRRTISGYITTRDCDRQGDVIVPQGMNYGPYMANPVVLMNHDYHSNPVAKTVSMKADEFGVRADMEFATSSDATETWELVKGGFLNAFSVGFVVEAGVAKGVQGFNETMHAWATAQKADRETADMVTRFITRSTLLEVSIVPVPCNPSALIDQISKGMISVSQGMMKRLNIEFAPRRIMIERAIQIERHIDLEAVIAEQVKKTLDTIRGRIA